MAGTHVGPIVVESLETVGVGDDFGCYVVECCKACHKTALPRLEQNGVVVEVNGRYELVDVKRTGVEVQESACSVEQQFSILKRDGLTLVDGETNGEETCTVIDYVARQEIVTEEPVFGSSP